MILIKAPDKGEDKSLLKKSKFCGIFRKNEPIKQEMLDMAEIPSTDFTNQLRETKKRLDHFFRIVVREDAVRIISEMKEILKDRNKWTALGDKQEELLVILGDVPEYIRNHSEKSIDGQKTPKRLISSFRYEGANKKVIDEAIKEYAKYTKKIRRISEINKDTDVEFLEKLNSVYDEYKSSTDYMTRLVNRLLKYNIGVAEEPDTETRVLILRQFLRAFGYDCVKEISSPELEEIVQDKFNGDINNITDEIFEYSEKAGSGKYNKEYFDAIVKLQGIIIYKSFSIRMTKELCEKLCAVVSDKAAEKDSIGEDVRILTDEALDGTAEYLKDCFYEPDSFSITCIRNYSDADIDAVAALNSALSRIYNKAKKEKQIDISKADLFIRASVVFDAYKDRITVSDDNIELLKKAFPELKCEVGKTLDSFMKEEKDKNAVKGLKKNTVIKNKERYKAIEELVALCESEFSLNENGGYSDAIFERADNRYNGAVSPSKKGSLYKKAQSILDGTERKEYKLLKISDDLANAKFSTQGKTREYLYIFAIAFNICKVENGHPNRIVDLEKNLFWDYYADNIVNNLPNAADSGESSDVLIDGYGINYKNFAEVIFLWSSEQKNMTEKEKLQTAYEMIYYCAKNGKTEKEFSEEKADAGDIKTEFYKTGYSDFRKLSKADFIKYILKNYPCKSTDSGSIEICNEPRTAKEVIAGQEDDVSYLLAEVEENLLFEETEDDLKAYFEDDSVLADFFNKYRYLVRNRCKSCVKNSGSAFPDCPEYFDCFSWADGSGKEKHIESCDDFYQEFIAGKTAREMDGLLSDNIRRALTQFLPGKQYFENSFSKVNELCSEEQQSLKLLLNRIKTRLQAEFDENEANLHFKKASRSTVIALCFYETVLINWLRRLSDTNTIFGSFEKFYDVFCKGTTFLIKLDNDGRAVGGTDNIKEVISDDKENKLITVRYPGADSLLEKSGYQKINFKNIFDIYTIYIAYRDNFFPIYSSQTDAFIDFYKNSYERFKNSREARGDIN